MVPVPKAKPAGPYWRSKFVAAEQFVAQVKVAEFAAGVIVVIKPGEAQAGAAAMVII